MQIDVWSDYACPWCALGTARLEVALRDFEHGDAVTVAHRAFELDPRAPATSAASSEEAVSRKYGMSPEQVRAGHAQITALGAEVGFTFDFDRVRLGNTFDAHRLTQAARGTAWEAPLVRRLFVARFSEGRQLSDHQVLRDIADSVGLPGTRHRRGARRPRLRRRGPRRRSGRHGARRDRRALLPHRWRLAGAGRAGRGDAQHPAASAPGHASAIESRISSTISTVVSGWRKAKRATVSPSHAVGVTKPIWSRSRRADQSS